MIGKITEQNWVYNYWNMFQTKLYVCHAKHVEWARFQHNITWGTIENVFMFVSPGQLNDSLLNDTVFALSV